jgi:hypothetical protein
VSLNQRLKSDAKPRAQIRGKLRARASALVWLALALSLGG